MIRAVTRRLAGWGPVAGDQELGGKKEKVVMEPTGELELLCLKTGTEMKRLKSRTANT